MKWVWCLVFFLFVVPSFSSAKVVVHDVDVQTEYESAGVLLGFMNISLVDVSADLFLTSNEDGSAALTDFLRDNAANFSCSVTGCMAGYESVGSQERLEVEVSDNETAYVGFVLEGENVRVSDVTFFAASDFGAGVKTPLSLSFFGRYNWTFTEFSEQYSARNYGCYNPALGTTGPKLRKVKYCELIEISETAAVFAGVDVTGDDDASLKMVIHPETGGKAISSCTYDPNQDAGCSITKTSGVFAAGNYQVCVEVNALTNYSILTETNGNTCGFAYDFGPTSSEQDFAIYAQTAKYADAHTFNASVFNFNTIASAADTYIETQYDRDCSETCVLPIEIRGVLQELVLDDLVLDYTTKGISRVTEEFSELERVRVMLDFTGVLDLKFAGFPVSRGGSYPVFLGDERLFTATIEDIAVTEVNGITPTIVPAGVPVELRALTSTQSSNLQYRWNFGGRNASSQVTTTPMITHTFPNIGVYRVEVSAFSSTVSSEKKSFDVEAISPADAINETLADKQAALDRIELVIASAPLWYQRELEKLVNITFFENELKRLRSASQTFSNSSGLVGVATSLYALRTPKEMHFSLTPDIPLIDSTSYIDPTPVALHDFGSGTSSATKYTNAILRWQQANILPKISVKEYGAIFDGEETGEVLRGYEAVIHSYLGETGYLVIDRPLEELVFKEGTKGIASGDYTLIELSGAEPQAFEFYTKGPKETLFYASPVLTNVLIEEEIDSTCNYNAVCEKELGENPRVCRSDCKPVVSLSIYLVLLFFVALGLYTLLQVWYKRHYERYLFENRTYLYNLLMFIANARAREIQEKEIVKKLGNMGWSHEHIIYAMKKSRGERTGMIEIIPVEKIASYIRNRKARVIAKQGVEIEAPKNPQSRFGGPKDGVGVKGNQMVRPPRQGGQGSSRYSRGVGQGNRFRRRGFEKGGFERRGSGPARRV